MKALLLRDLITQRWNILFGAFYSLFFIFAFNLVRDSPFRGFTYVVSGVVVAYMILAGSFGADKNNTQIFMLSLPTTRLQAVNEKFFLLLGSAAFGTLCAALLNTLAAALIPTLLFVPIGPMHLLRVLGGTLAMSFILPFYFRFGHLMIKYVLYTLIGVGIVAQIIGVVVLSLRGESGGLRVSLDAIIGFFEASGELRRNLGFVCVAGVIGLVSYGSSVALYLRRDM